MVTATAHPPATEGVLVERLVRYLAAEHIVAGVVPHGPIDHTVLRGGRERDSGPRHEQNLVAVARDLCASFHWSFSALTSATRPTAAGEQSSTAMIRSRFHSHAPRPDRASSNDQYTAASGSERRIAFCNALTTSRAS